MKVTTTDYYNAGLQEAYAQQLSIRAGEVLVHQLQLCQMQVGLLIVSSVYIVLAW